MKDKEKLDDFELDNVTGGTMTTQEKIEFVKKNIENFYGFVPENIRTVIIAAYEQGGKDMARSLAQRLIKNHPTWSGIVDLLI
ncbi:MAG: hypothetical protein KBS74_00845 [Clostridiales bacterium]|nr:hypothetical protein [Candidatus Cacconaster stercorequi]